MQMFHVDIFLQNLNSLTRLPYIWEQKYLVCLIEHKMSCYKWAMYMFDVLHK